MITTDFLGKQWNIDCMGCAIAAGSMPVPGGFIRLKFHLFVAQAIARGVDLSPALTRP